MKQIWRVVVIMVCMLCITSCNKDNRKPQNNNKEKSELTVNTIGTDDEVENGSNVDNDNKSENSKTSDKANGDGTIDNPYQSDLYYEMNLEVCCQIPDQGEGSEIVIEISKIVFDEGEGYDNVNFSALIKLLSKNNTDPIRIDDYVSLVYYNEDNQEVGKAEYLHDSDSEDEIGLVFDKSKEKGWVDDLVYGTESEISKAAIRYFDGEKYKEVFLKRYPLYGGINNPITRWDSRRVNEAGIEMDRLDTTGNIMASAKISVKSFLHSDNESILALNFYNWGYNTVEEEEQFKPMKPKEYFTVSYYDKDGKIGDTEYLMGDQNGDTDVSIEYDQTCSLYLAVTDNELEGRIPTMVAIRYHNREEYKQIFFSLEK